MTRLLLFLSCLLFSCSVYAQVSIPNFKGNASKQDDPFTTIKDYDLIIACRSYSSSKHAVVYSVLVLKGTHWRKLAYKQAADYTPLSSQEPPLKDKPTTDAECNVLYNSLRANNLFTVLDDSKLPKCNESKDIIDGQEQTVTHNVEDGSEYSLWIMAPKKTKHLYYYAPEFFVQYCPQNKDRLDVLKIIDLLNKE